MSHESEAAQNTWSQAQVNLQDEAAVRRWSEALGTTDEALVGAAQVVGTRIDKIKDYLGAGGMAGDQEDA